MSRIGKIEKKTSNRFLNFYELEAIHRDGKVSPYYVSSRAKDVDQLITFAEKRGALVHKLRDLKTLCT